MKYAVHTPTRQDGIRLMEAYEEFTDWVLISGDKPTEFDNWSDHKEKTCVDFEDLIEYCDKLGYIYLGFSIITVDQAINALKKYGADAPNHNLMTKGFYKGAEETVKMTMAEVNKALGKNVEIVE